MENPVSLIGVYSLIGRIRLIAGIGVVSWKRSWTIVDFYSRPPTTFLDVHKLAREGRV
jgi:hypothetical protein